MIHPESKRKFIWDFAIAILFTLDLVWNTYATFIPDSLVIVNTIILPIYILDMCLSAITMYY
jgi:hypothetical protein